MAFADDIAGDYAIFDGGVTVTLQQIRAEGRNEISISNALRQPLSRRSAQAAGVDIVGDEIVWSLNKSQVGNNGVRAKSDKIVNANVTPNEVWNIVQASLNTLQSRWDCICRLEE